VGSTPTASTTKNYKLVIARVIEMARKNIATLSPLGLQYVVQFIGSVLFLFIIII